ncbi:MAG: nicotinamide riboside transporter PnuC [Dysgonomonas sp.]
MGVFLAFITDNWVSITGAIIGLVFLYLEYKANIWMWAASIVMAAFYIFIFYKTGLYASMCIYIYFFFASIYGWVMWITRNRNEQTGDEIITHIQKRYFPFVIGGIFVTFVTIYIILVQFGSNPVYIAAGDALTTALNIIALWMISRKWVEQWLLVIPANAISSGLLFAQHDIMSGVLFFIYFIVSIFGYYRWKKMVPNYDQPS